jgi:hypothetical protein
MQRELADDLMKALTALTEPMNRATAAAMEIAHQDEREAMLRAIGSVMDIVYADLMLPITRQYPDLDPDCSRDQGTSDAVQ